ncbi:MAG: hypothetical protein QMD44_10480 [Thermodesulfovibrionales bacterium]|jgi:hypothetical protein|nr:hypothetical protein [Thermodesulfovibrionales bacterium]
MNSFLLGQEEGRVMFILIAFSAYVGQELVNINERQAIYKELQYLIEDRLNDEKQPPINEPNLINN